ncbi:hypothetical protein [Streptomyces sp. AM8-1-1]|uniref:hypothetical protein n=1 Tax=Streptomyces sp. AM8-1-1 TaxID=3075825 RepID=UPI0039B6EE9F
MGAERTRWVRADMDVVVIEPRKGRYCAECRQGPLAMHIREFNAPLCPVCADLAHLVHLPRGPRHSPAAPAR